MTRKTQKETKSTERVSNEKEILEQEMLELLAEFRNVLSPYWSARIEHPHVR
jgi:hypothetical protein